MTSNARLYLVFAAALAGPAVACADGETEPEPLVCDPVAPGESRMLVDHDRWTLAPAEEDPWAAFRPAEDIGCPDGARKPEDFAGVYAWSVITTDCPYTTVVQPTLAPACKGEEFYVWIWNYALVSPVDATAHLAVQVGDLPIWSGTRAIPGPSALEATRITLPHDVPAGTPIYFHVRNHGSNSYELIALSIVAPEPEGP